MEILAVRLIDVVLPKLRGRDKLILGLRHSCSSAVVGGESGWTSHQELGMKGPEDTMYCVVLVLAAHCDQFLAAKGMGSSRPDWELPSNGWGLERKMLHDLVEEVEKNDTLVAQDVGSTADESRYMDTGGPGPECHCTRAIDWARTAAGEGKFEQSWCLRNLLLLHRFDRRRARQQRPL
jgi:hypothetical protein